MSSKDSQKSVAIVFGKWLPYHFARLEACVAEFDSAGISIVGLQYSEGSTDYSDFRNSSDISSSLPWHTLNISNEETGFNLFRVLIGWHRAVKSHNIGVVFLPSYWNWSITMRVLSRLMGCKVIMMNESHAGTEKAKGLKRWVKRLIVSTFDGALVGGEPHRRYFSGLGLPTDRIVTGYDAINNTYFTNAATDARSNEKDFRTKLCLPECYLLSLGRMVEKKNLNLIIDAYAKVKVARPDTDLRLAMVGSGAGQAELVERCAFHGLSHSFAPAEGPDFPDVIFYGFRQIEENPIFYALAEAFVLPSFHEEWGLVVNEAMACRLPILVSSEVGSAEDLVIAGNNGFHFDPSSSSELAKHILYLLDHPEERLRMGKASLNRIQDWGCENFARSAKRIVEVVTR